MVADAVGSERVSDLIFPCTRQLSGKSLVTDRVARATILRDYCSETLVGSADHAPHRVLETDFKPVPQSLRIPKVWHTGQMLINERSWGKENECKPVDLSFLQLMMFILLPFFEPAMKSFGRGQLVPFHEAVPELTGDYEAPGW